MTALARHLATPRLDQLLRDQRDPRLDVLLGIKDSADATLALDARGSVDIAQSLEISQIEQADSHVWVVLTQKPEFAVLPGDEPLSHRRQLEIQVVLREKKIRGDELDRSSVPPPSDRERRRLVRPTQPVKCQKPRQLDLGRMSESIVVRLEQPSQRR